MRRTLLALALLAPNAAGAAELGVSRTFGDWIVGCDNARSCTAVGLSPEDAEAFAYLSVRREAGAEAGPIVSVTILNELGAPGPIRLSLDDTPLPVETLDQQDDGSSFAFAELGPVDHGAFLDALLPNEALGV